MTDIAAHYSHLLIQYGFAAVVACIIVVLVGRVFQRFVLSMLDELRDTTALFRAALNKKQQSADDKRLIATLALAYAIVSGLFFVAIITLISNLATPVG